MGYAANLATLAGMHLLMAMLPGPNTVVVSWLAATRSRGAAVAAMAGVVSATLVWVMLALWGVGALLLEAGALYRVLRVLGAAYLVYVGVRMVAAGWRRPSGLGSARAAPRLGERRPFAAGLLTTLSNPKSAVFWTSAFLLAVPPEAPAWFYGAVVAVIAVQSTLWYGALALLFSTGYLRERYLRFAGKLDLLAGAVMVALGLKLADEVRRELAVAAAT